MTTMPHLPKPRDLALPVRDLVRGVRWTASGPRALLEPAVERLPQPLTHWLGRVAHMLDDVGVGPLRLGPPTPERVRRAADDLAGRNGTETQPAVFARVATYGLATALASSEDGEMLVSETVAAWTFSQVARDGTLADQPAARAASVIVSLDRHHFAGVAPGLAAPLERADRDRVALALFAVMLWLLTERPERHGDEEHILRLSIAVARAIEAEVLAAGRDIDALTALLAENAAMI